METAMLEKTPDAGTVMVGGKPYVYDAKRNLVALENVKAADKLQDETVRKVIGYARELSAQVARFKQHTFDDLQSYEDLLAQEYGAKVGGAKGNKTFMTFDGLMKVSVQVQDYIDFGPQLQIAKGLIDECLREWTADSVPQLRTIVTHAFNVDNNGQINRSAIFALLRYDLDEERWVNAMTAIRDAMRVVSSKLHVRCYERDSQDGDWRHVTIDLAKA